MHRYANALAATLILMAVPAAAQHYPLVGDWFSTFMDPRGITNSLLHAQFRNDGQLVVQMSVSGQGGSGQMTALSRYRITGPNSYSATVLEYQPSSAPPFLGSPGQTADCTFQFESAIVMDVACGGNSPTRYTRQD